MTLYDQLQSAGILDAKWGLPLGANAGRDNIAKDTAVMLALMSPDERKAIALKVETFIAMAMYPATPGLYFREAGNTSRNSVDNLIGHVVIGELLPTDDAKFIHERGERMNWTYSVAYPDVAFNPFLPWRYKVRQDWYGRFPGFPPFVRLACGAPVQDDGLSLFYGSVIATCDTPKENTSDKILLWLQWQVIPEPTHWLVSQAYNHWKKAMTEQYGDLGGLFAVYYGADHVFTQAARGRSF
jgi:hypothetical protein